MPLSGLSMLRSRTLVKNCNIIKSEKTLFMGFEALNEFLKVRCLKHKDYFIKNDIIKTNYEFLVKVVDFYAKLAYNKVEEQKV